MRPAQSYGSESDSTRAKPVYRIPADRKTFRTKRQTGTGRAKAAEWDNFAQVREHYPAADLVNGLLLFNIGDNRYCLIVFPVFSRRKLDIKALPKVIETREAFDHYVEMMEQFDSRAERGERLSPEENALLALLEQLVKEYDVKIEMPKTAPYKLVLHLMEHKGLRQADMLPVFGSRSVASDVLNGLRAISKAHARKLADYFRLPADRFI